MGPREIEGEQGEARLLKRAEERGDSAAHLSSRYYYAASYWTRVHYILGAPAAIVAGVAGVAALQDHTAVAAALAISAAALSALVTFLNSAERAQLYAAAGHRFGELTEEFRELAEFDIPRMGTDGLSAGIERYRELSRRFDEVRSNSPLIPPWTYWTLRRRSKRVSRALERDERARPTPAD